MRIASQLNVGPSSLMICGPPEPSTTSSTTGSSNTCPGAGNNNNSNNSSFVSCSLMNNNNNNTNTSNNGNMTKILSGMSDHKLLSSLNIDGMHSIQVKLASTYPPPSSNTSITSTTAAPNKSFVDFYSAARIDAEHEKSLPSVLIANNGFAFDMFSRLDDLDQPEIRARIRNILRLIPTNPKLVEAFDSVVLKRSDSNTASVAAAAVVATPTLGTAIIIPSYPSNFGIVINVR